MRRLAALLAALLALVLAGPAGAFSRQDVTVTADDGLPIAATLWLPDGVPPAGGWPAIVMFHGLGGSRQDMNRLAQLAFLPGDHYAVLAYDARGHGQTGGLITIDGPREIADARDVFDWLRARPDISGSEIGAWGISYGGGAVWGSLVAGVPWAAIEVCETWTNLQSALAPQGLAKSGVIAGFLGALPAGHVDPSVLAIRDAAFAGNLAAVASYAAARSSIQKLAGVRTPVFLMQGRRDFAFGLDQALSAWKALAGPKRLWIGNHGHAPSTFPAVDTPAMLAEGRRWFDRYLRGVPNGIDGAKPVVIAAAGSTRVERLATLPRTIVWDDTRGGRTAIGQSGRVVRSFGRLAAPLEVFGSPTVRVDTVTALGGWSRLVAVLSAATPAGKEIVVAGGGVPTRPGRHTYAISLLDQATFLPKGSKLTLSLGSSSLAQSPTDLLYLDLPMPPGARLVIGATRLELPVLALPVSR